MGMIGVDKIGEIRRAYFEQDRSIQEIVRALLVSRATVRKVIRGHKTEFKYARGVQPTPRAFSTSIKPRKCSSSLFCRVFLRKTGIHPRLRGDMLFRKTL